MTSRKHDRVTVYQSKDGDWRWRRRAANGETVSDSSEGYEEQNYALTMAAELNPGITVEVES